MAKSTSKSSRMTSTPKRATTKAKDGMVVGAQPKSSTPKASGSGSKRDPLGWTSESNKSRDPLGWTKREPKPSRDPLHWSGGGSRSTSSNLSTSTRSVPEDQAG